MCCVQEASKPRSLHSTGYEPCALSDLHTHNRPRRIIWCYWGAIGISGEDPEQLCHCFLCIDFLAEIELSISRLPPIGSSCRFVHTLYPSTSSLPPLYSQKRQAVLEISRFRFLGVKTSPQTRTRVSRRLRDPIPTILCTHVSLIVLDLRSKFRVDRPSRSLAVHIIIWDCILKVLCSAA